MNRRIALCIGIANYRASELKLLNPVNDAKCIDAVLKARGFDSTLLLNSTAEGITQALTDLRAKIIDRAGTFGVVYFAGHAIEIGGFGVLLPADMPYPVSSTRIAHLGVPVLEIAHALEVGPGPKIILIDACRNAVDDWDSAQMLYFNEWAKQEARRLRAAAEAENVAIAYSTAAGQSAYDGCAANSLYCEKLQPALLRHDASIVEVLTQCGQQVIADTRAKQRPWVYTNLSVKAGFSDLPKFALVSSTTLTRQPAAGTRLHVRSMDDSIAVSVAGRLQLLSNGVERDFVGHNESLTAVAVWEDEVLLAGQATFVSYDTSMGPKKQNLQPTAELRTKCTNAHGIAISPRGTFAIVYGSGGYSVLKRSGKRWRVHYESKRPQQLYGAVFQSNCVVYLGGSADYVLRLELSSGKPRVQKFALGDSLHVYDLAWSVERRSIAAVCNGGIVVWVDPASGVAERRKMFDWPSVDVHGAYGRLRRMELSPEEANLYLTDPQQFDTTHGANVWRRTHQSQRPDYDLLCCDVTADNRVLAIGADVGLVFLVDVRSNEHFATLDAGSDIGVPLQWMACDAGGAIHVLGRDGVVRCFEPVCPQM